MHSDESIDEIISHRCWPIWRHIQRTRRGPDKTIHEVELAFPRLRNKPPQSFEQYEPEFEEEAILLCQVHRANENVKEMAFCPEHGHEYRIIVSCGEAKRTFEFPIALRYSNLLRKFAKMYPLEDTEFQSSSAPQTTMQRHNLVELGEGHTGLWLTVLEYDPHEVKHIPGYIKQHVKWHIQDQQKALSTEAGAKFRDPANKRILKERLERSGGELDAPLPWTGEDNSESDSQPPSVRDALTLDRLGPMDPLMTDEYAYYRKIMNYLPDPIDRNIVWGLVAMGLTQMELAHELKLSQSAVAQCVKKISPIIRSILGS